MIDSWNSDISLISIRVECLELPKCTDFGNVKWERKNWIIVYHCGTFSL